MTEANKLLLQRWFEQVWNQKSEAAIDEMFSKQGKSHGFPDADSILIGPEPFKAVLTNDMAALAHFSERDWAEVIFVTHSGMSQATFADIALNWTKTAKHPRFKRLFTELVYQPMIEVLAYLRANEFETFIVTGGGQDFHRPNQSGLQVP